MIPNKIYIQPNAHDGWFEGEKPSGIFEEYIRKDALLELIKTAITAAFIQRNFNNCPAEQEARIDAYESIRYEIESL